MKRIKDTGKYKCYWERMNADAYVTNVHELLNRQWGKITKQINDENLIVSLRSGGDVIGSALPAAYLYEYQRKMLSSADDMPVVHFFKHKEESIDQKIEDVLRYRGNVILLDQDARPILGILNREMSIDFNANSNGQVVAADYFLSHMFNHTSYEYIPKGTQNEIRCFETGELIPNFTLGAHLQPMEMPESDRELVAQIHQVIKGVEKPNARKVIDAVRNASLTID